jgi:hypothetical protein
MAEEKTIVGVLNIVRVTVDYSPGRWGQVFHIFDLDGKEISLHQKEATQLARTILTIAKEKEKAKK